MNWETCHAVLTDLQTIYGQRVVDNWTKGFMANQYKIVLYAGWKILPIYKQKLNKLFHKYMIIRK